MPYVHQVGVVGVDLGIEMEVTVEGLGGIEEGTEEVPHTPSVVVILSHINTCCQYILSTHPLALHHHPLYHPFSHPPYQHPLSPNHPSSLSHPPYQHPQSPTLSHPPGDSRGFGGDRGGDRGGGSRFGDRDGGGSRGGGGDDASLFFFSHPSQITLK